MILWKQTVALRRKITALETSLSRLGFNERAILDLVEKQGFVTVADVMAATGALRETVRKRLGQLVKKASWCRKEKAELPGIAKPDDALHRCVLRCRTVVTASPLSRFSGNGSAYTSRPRFRAVTPPPGTVIKAA